MTEYKEIVKRVIRDYAQYTPSHGDIEVETILDDEIGHYEIMYIGWQKSKRIHGCIMHVDVRDGKVWVQFDGTEDGIAKDFLDAGIPANKIVIGFHSAAMRKHTSFAQV